MQNKKSNSPIIVSSHDVHLDSDYVQWIHDIKERFRGAQIKAAVKVNSEQLLFNWQLGRDLVLRKSEEKWGRGIVEQLSLDLQQEFPEVKGFSARNLWNMKKWYSFYALAEDSDDLIQAVDNKFNFDSIKLQQIGAEIKEDDGREKLHQVGAEMVFPAFFGFVPWRHHVEIVTKCKSVVEALFYLQKTIEEEWSFIMTKTLIIESGQKPTEEQLKEVEEAKKSPINFDEDCEELSPAMMKAFKSAVVQRNRKKKA